MHVQRPKRQFIPSCTPSRSCYGQPSGRPGGRAVSGWSGLFWRRKLKLAGIHSPEPEISETIRSVHGSDHFKPVQNAATQIPLNPVFPTRHGDTADTPDRVFMLRHPSPALNSGAKSVIICGRPAKACSASVDRWFSSVKPMRGTYVLGGCPGAFAA